MEKFVHSSMKDATILVLLRQYFDDIRARTETICVANPFMFLFFWITFKKGLYFNGQDYTFFGSAKYFFASRFRLSFNFSFFFTLKKRLNYNKEICGFQQKQMVDYECTCDLGIWRFAHKPLVYNKL